MYLTDSGSDTILHRAVVIDMIIDIHASCHMASGALFAAVNLLDRHLHRSARTASREVLFNTGIAALLVISRSERGSMAPILDLCDTKVLELEPLVLETMDGCGCPSTLAFRYKLHDMNYTSCVSKPSFEDFMDDLNV